MADSFLNVGVIVSPALLRCEEGERRHADRDQTQLALRGADVSGCRVSGRIIERLVGQMSLHHPKPVIVTVA
jgi:hypothetical protein